MFTNFRRICMETAGTGGSTAGTPPGTSASTAGAPPASMASTATPPAATPPPVTTPPPASPGGTPPPTSGAKWYEGLPDEARGFVEAKGYPDLAAAINSHRHLEKLMGAPKERLFTLPEKSDDPKWSEIYKALGKPEKADAYKIPGADANPEFAKWARETFHGANLTAAQAEQVVGKWNDFVKGQNESQFQATAGKSQEQLRSLQTEWGQAFEQNVGKARDIWYQGLGMNHEQYQAGEKAFGVDGWAKVLHSITTKLGVSTDEPSFRRGQGEGGGFMTPAAARERRDMLSTDKDFANRIAAGDAKARDEWDRLGRAIFAGNA